MKMHQLWAHGLVLSITLLPPFVEAVAQDRETVWGVSGTLNSLSWDHLAEIQPVRPGGPFSSSGWGVEFGAYMSVARWGPVLVLAGTELSFMDFGSDVEFDYWTIGTSFRFGKRDGRYLDVDLGLGEYGLVPAYIDCAVVIGHCFTTKIDDSESGAYIGLTGEVGKGILVGVRAHFVEFDPIRILDLGANRAKGPIYSIFFGWEYGNWRR